MRNANTRLVILALWGCLALVLAALIFGLDHQKSPHSMEYLIFFATTSITPIGVGLTWALKDTGEIKESVQKTEKLTDDFDERVVGLVKLAVKNDIDAIRDDVKMLKQDQHGIKRRVDQIESQLKNLASCEVKPDVEPKGAR